MKRVSYLLCTRDLKIHFRAELSRIVECLLRKVTDEDDNNNRQILKLIFGGKRIFFYSIYTENSVFCKQQEMNKRPQGTGNTHMYIIHQERQQEMHLTKPTVSIKSLLCVRKLEMSHMNAIIICGSTSGLCTSEWVTGDRRQGQGQEQRKEWDRVTWE